MFFRISCFVRFPAYQTLALVEPLNGSGVVAAKSRIACMLMGDVGTAPAATASVDGRPFLHVAEPVLRLSTIGQTDVVSMLNVPRLLCERKFDGGLMLPIFVDVQPGPLNHTSSAVPSIWAFSMLFMLVADAPERMPW